MLNQIGDMCPTIAFVSQYNSFFLKLAQTYAKQLAEEEIKIYCAVLSQDQNKDDNSIDLIKEENFNDYSEIKSNIEDIPGFIDIVITLSCSLQCPMILCKKREDWEFGELNGQPDIVLQLTKELLKARITKLINDVKKGNI